MKRLAKTSAGVAAAALLAVGGAGAWAVGASLGPSPASAANESAIDVSAAKAAWSPKLADWAKPSSSADALPDFLVSGPQKLTSILPSTTKRLADSEGKQYWLALNTNSESCLVILLPGELQYASATCADEKTFLESGIALQAADRNSSTRAYVLPDGYTEAAKAAGLQVLSTNLAVSSADATQTESIALEKPADTAGKSSVAPQKLLLPRFDKADF